MTGPTRGILPRVVKGGVASALGTPRRGERNEHKEPFTRGGREDTPGGEINTAREDGSESAGGREGRRVRTWIEREREREREREEERERGRERRLRGRAT